MGAGRAEGRLGFIGTGHIAAAVVSGLAGLSGWRRPILVSPRNAARAAQLAAAFDCVTVARSNAEIVRESATVILALRPQDAEEGLKGLGFRADQTIVSFMAMVPMARLGAMVAPARRLVRMVPLPGIAERAGPIVAFPHDPETAALFSPLGDLIEVESEAALHALWAITGLAAPFYALLSTVQGWGAAHGAGREAAGSYARAFFHGLTAAPGTDFTSLARSVQTKGGLNEAALARLEKDGWPAALRPVLDEILARLEGSAENGDGSSPD